MKIKLFDRPACAGAVLSAALLLATTAHAAINISTQATQNMSCSGGVCTATAKKAYLNVNDVTGMLAAGDLKVVSGAGGEDIHIQAPFNWTSTSRLTLDAQRSIEFKKPVSVAGTGALTLVTNDGGTGGDYWFDEGASVTFWDTSSSLIINGQSFTLVEDIKTLAGDIVANPFGNFAFANSYDASVDGVYKHAPVLVTMSGEFEGLGNFLSNLQIRKDSDEKNLNVALFAQLASPAAIRNISVQNPLIQGAADHETLAALVARNDGGIIAHAAIDGGVVSAGYVDYPVVGGLVGENSVASVITACSSSASASGFIDSRVGGLVGSNSGNIFNSSAGGSTSSQTGSYVGGLVGFSDGTIDSSFATGNVSAAVGDEGAHTYGGGLLGSGYATNSHATGTVEGGDIAYIGGLIGEGGAANSFATGTVSGAYAEGGLIGIANASVISSFATGNASSGVGARVGGLVGSLLNDDNNSGSIETSYSTGSVSGDDYSSVGGLIGFKDRLAPVDQAYSLGAPRTGETHRSYVGGSIGFDGATHHLKHFITSTFWDFNTSGISDPSQGAGNVLNDPGITGLTDQQLKSGLPAGFDPRVWGRMRTSTTAIRTCSPIRLRRETRR